MIIMLYHVLVGHNMLIFNAVSCNGRSQHANLYHAHDSMKIGHSMLIFDINLSPAISTYITNVFVKKCRFVRYVTKECIEHTEIINITLNIAQD